MRCNSCNIDVSENTKKCPLCGAATVDDEPVIKGIKTAYYPKVTYKKPKPNFNLIFGIVWLATTVVMLIIDSLLNDGDITLTLIVTTAMPCVWAFAIRPIYTKKYYFGGFLFSDTIFLSLWLIVMSLKIFKTVEPALSFAVPGVLILAILIALTDALLRKKNSGRAPIFLIMLGTIAFILGVVCIFISGVKFYVYSIPFSLALFAITLLWVRTPEAIRDELSARFHI